jgi:hypothetical protein
MRYLISAAALIAAGLVALPAIAQPPGPQGPGEPGGRMRDPEFRQRMIEEFDKDGDGRLSDEERQAMRESMRERFGRGGPGGPPPEAGEGGPPEGLPPEGAQAERQRPERRRGIEQPEGPPGPRNGDRSRGRRLEPLFDWFDENGDGMLSREEFGSLAEFAGRHHPGHAGGRPSFGHHGPDGTPWGHGAARRGADGRRGPEAWPGGPHDGYGRRGPEGSPRRDAGPPPRQRPVNPPPEAERDIPTGEPI